MDRLPVASGGSQMPKDLSLTGGEPYCEDITAYVRREQLCHEEVIA
jgi:hypothetical protein